MDNKLMPETTDLGNNTLRSVLLQRLTIAAESKLLLNESNIEFPGGKISVIVGGSGAGKSVLLRVLAGLLPQSDPELRWTGAVETSDGETLEQVGVVFQQFALFDELSPRANVQFAIDHRYDPTNEPELSSQDWLDELRVPSQTRVASLSGGQKQRLAIARTLAANPEIILYDEPTSGLDAASGRQVATLIQDTQQSHRKTSIVVTHDYATLIPIADHVFLLDSESRKLVEIAKDQWTQIPERMQPVAIEQIEQPAKPLMSTLVKTQALRFVESSGNIVLAALRLPIDLLQLPRRFDWAGRFLVHYLYLIAGPSAWVYMIMAGVIVGFSSTFFTFRYLPFALYTKPLLLEDLLAAIGFALYRILVPVMATILIAARCGAAAAADVGVKQYGAQIDALQTLGVRRVTYLLTPIVLAFVIGTPALEWASYQAARIISLMTFLMSHPTMDPHFWALHFDRELESPGLLNLGNQWVFIKNVVSGIGIGVIAYHQGSRRKNNASDVSKCITATVLWTTLFVLLVHFTIAFFEF